MPGEREAESHPGSSVVSQESLQDWRQRVLDGVLRAVLVSGVLTLVTTTPIVLQSGKPLLAAAYWLVLLPAIYFVLGKGLSYQIRLGGLVFIGYLVGLGALVGEHRLADFGVQMYAIATFAALVGGVRWGITSLGLCTATIVALGYLNVDGFLGPTRGAAADLGLTANWISFGAIWAFYTSTLVFSILYVIHRFENALRESRELGEMVRKRGLEKLEAERRQREAEAKLAQAQKMEAIGQVAGGVAHDFNNLLTAIVGGVEMAKLDAADEAAVRQWLTTIDDAAQQASRLTRQLLAFSRRDVVAPAAVALDMLIRDQERVLSRILPEDLTFELDLGAGGRHVLVDPGQFHQVLLNLVVNARDATPRGGQLSISTAPVTDLSRLPPHHARADAWLEVAVRDNGAGIREADLEHVFDPFFTTKPAGKGTGLGLSMVKEIVTSWGGGIHVASEPGQGSVFTLFIPQTVTPDDDPTMPIDAEQVLEGSERVLVVDDHAHVGGVIRASLEDAGYTVLSASDGVEALECLEDQQGRIDLIVSDVVMPNMSGPEMAEVVARQYPRIPILFCSGYTPDESLRERVAKGNALLLQKPFNRTQLLSKVREILE